MKKSILAIFTFLFCTSTFASHLQGGEIYWECSSNGNYIFTLVLYRDCNGIILTTLPETIKNGSTTYGNITCTFVSKIEVSESCYDPLQSATCAIAQSSTINLLGATEKFTYRSNPIALTGTPPAAGWTFSWNSCCRPTSVQNTNTGWYYMESKMYVNPAGGCQYNSPRFLERPGGLVSGKGSFSSLAITQPISDSVVHSFTSPLQSINSSVVYNAGYSTNAPFPDASEDSTNGPIALDPSTGLITYEINNLGTSSSGTFAYAVKAESWRNGILYSEIVRNAIAISDYDTPLNNAPYVAIDSATASHTINKLSRGLVEINSSIGDTVEFDILASDFDFNTNGTPQNIIFEAEGNYLDSTWGGGNQSNTVLLTPVSPQTGFTSGLQNKVRFKWIIPAIGNKNSQQFVFNFTMQDDACPYPEKTSLSVILNSANPLYINMDSARICDLDTIASIVGHSRSGNYLWSPSNNITNTTIASPLFYPNASQYYYLIDPNNPGIIDSVYIEVEQSAQLSLAYAGAILTPSANTSLDFHQWYFNGIPFLHPFSALNPFGSGLYYVEGTNGPCNETSNITAVAAGSFKTVITPTNGNSLNAPIQLIGSLGIDFYLTDPDHVKLKGINLIGLYNGKSKQAALGDNLNVKLYEKATQTELWSTDVSVTQQGDLLHIPLTFNQFVLGTEYTLAVTGDTSLYFTAYQGVTFPYEPDNNGLFVIGANEGIAQQYPSVSTDKVLPLSMEFKSIIGLNSSKVAKLSIYPNPATKEFIIDGLAETELYQIEARDAVGKIIPIEVLRDNTKASIQINNWAKGVYFIHIKGGDVDLTEKIIKE